MEVLCAEGQVTHQEGSSFLLLSAAGPISIACDFIPQGTSLRLPVGLRIRGPFHLRHMPCA